MMKTAVRSLILLCILFYLQINLVAGNVHFKKGAPHVQLANGGIISGKVQLSRDGRPYSSFMGIPYATIPERFQESVLVTNPTWQGTFSAAKPGAICSQKKFGYSKDHYGEEDCLNLNVYVPISTTGSGKNGFPVMVWIHGGAFNAWTGSMFGGKYFMDENVILVTINYRLGVFGFLSTGDNVVPGNNGLKDMVVALKWIQENIQKFGGSPSKVTIFGESAGGAAVHHLLLSPTTKGLFHRAISQSGSALNMWAYQPNPKQIAVELATYMKCPTAESLAADITSEEILKCLKNASSEELNQAQFVFSAEHWPHDFRNLFFLPTLEPENQISSLTPFMTESPISLISKRENNLTEIPFMLGVTKNEGTFFSGPVIVTQEALQDMDTKLENIAPIIFDYGKFLTKEEQSKVSQELRKFYFGGKPISKETRTAITNVYTDANFLHGIYKSALDTAARGKRNPVYFYQYAYKGPISLATTILPIEPEEAEMVGHADELLHLFDLGAVFPEDIIKADSPDEEFSKNLVRLWTSFAVHGEPKHTWGSAPLRKWERVSKREGVGLDAMRWFRIDSNPSSDEISYSLLERIKWWDKTWDQYILPSVMSQEKPGENTDKSSIKTEL